MTAEDVQAIIDSQIGDAIAGANDHGVLLPDALVLPKRISIIQRIIVGGSIHEELIDVWLVLQESHVSPKGYQIVMSDDAVFGLAADGFASDAHPVLIGWCGDLVTTLRCM